MKAKFVEPKILKRELGQQNLPTILTSKLSLQLQFVGLPILFYMRIAQHFSSGCHFGSKITSPNPKIVARKAVERKEGRQNERASQSAKEETIVAQDAVV